MEHIVKWSKWLVFLSLFLSRFFLTATPIEVPSHIYYAGSQDITDHPGIYPFISYITFRNMCDFIIDSNTKEFDPDKVQQGDVIFVRTWFLEWFEQNVHDLIKHPYILVSSGEGAWKPNPTLARLLYDPKVAAWFGRNMIFSYHPKLFQLPMGQDLALFILDPGVRKSLDDAVRNLPAVKKHLLYMCFYPREYGDRNRIQQLFSNASYCLFRESVGRPQFYEDIAASKFVLSPLGFETDCVRTWEALVLHSIPIVEHTFLDPIYEGLPVVIVEDWTEINESFLNEKYDELKDVKVDKAYFDNWKDLIEKTKTRVKKGDLSFTYPDATRFSENDLTDLMEIINKPSLQNHKIYYKSFCSIIRAFQLLKESPKIEKLFLCDQWLNLSIIFRLSHYIQDKNLYPLFDRTIFLFDDQDFFKFLDSNQPAFIFFDLNYYRNSLFINFSSFVTFEGNFRHSLKRDLKLLYERLSPGSCICGNMKGDPYVNKALDWMASQYGLTIEIKNNFWIITKKQS